MISFIHLRYSTEVQGNDLAFENGSLPPGFMEILRSEPESRLARLFRGEAISNRRTHDSALAHALLACGFTEIEISAVLRVNKYGRIWTCPCPEEYIAQAISIARLTLYEIAPLVRR